MKIDIPNKPIQSGGVVTSSDFRIKNSAKAFSILSSGLYSNKYQAILRELGCNAYDSHVEAGKADTPFVVHLPTRLNPEFYVEDFGVGLDHDGVVNIYTTYFESTKQDSNDFVGCMGLGSKSPFSYTDNFAITATKDGVRRHYTAYINEEGVPSIALMGEVETDEPDGVKVAFAVTEGNDMYRFRNEASSVYKWFKTRPEIKGDRIDIPELKFAEMNLVPGVHARDTGGSSYHNESYAMMGNVAYPIKLDELDEDEGKDAVLHNQIRDLYNKGALVVEFDIGDLDVAASREELSYIPHTVNSLYNKGKEIIEHLGTYIDKELSGAKTKWDRIARLEKLHATNKHLFTPAIKAYIDANPRKFFKHMEFNLYGLRTYVALRDFDRISSNLKVSYYRMETSYQNDKVTAKRQQTRHMTITENGKDEYANVWQIEPSTTIIFHDEKGGLLPRVKEAVIEKQFSNRNVMTFQVAAKDNSGNPIDKDAIFAKIKRLLGNPKPIMSSTLPKVSPTSGSKRGLSAYYFTTKYRNGGYTRDGVKLELETDIKELNKAKANGKQKYVYYPLSHKSADLGTTTMDPDTFYNFLKRYDVCKFLGVPVDHIYGVNKTTRKLLAGNNEWVNLFDLFSEKFAKIDWQAAKDEARSKYIYETIVNGEYEFQKANSVELATFKGKNTPFGKLVDAYLANKGNSKKEAKLDYDALIRGAMTLASGDKREKLSKMIDDLKIGNIDKDVKELTNNVEKAYPMLKHLSLNGWNAQKHWRDALEYIKLVDSTL